MSTTKKLLPLSLVASLLLITACGGGGSTPKKEDTTTPSSTKEVNVPQKISIDIPDALKLKREDTKSINKLSSIAIGDYSPAITSYGYSQLQSTINQAEESIIGVKKNLEYLNLMMPDIVNECNDTPIGETCNIESGVIKLTVEGQNLSMGEVKYTQQADSKKYQHIVVLDLKPTLESMMDMGQTIAKDLETVKWSVDEKHIETFSDVKIENESYTMQLRYDKAEDNSSKMTITDSFSDAEMKGNFTLKLDEKSDAINTVNVETTGTFQLDETSDTFNSQGVVSDNGGYLVSKGSFFDSNYAEKETFDATGKLLQSTYCHNNEGCNLADSSSWIKYDNEAGIIDRFDETGFDDNFPEDIDIDFQEPLELTFTQDKSFPKYTYCMILPSDYNGSLNEDDVYDNSVGSFARFDDELFGILFEIGEKDNINSLPVLCNSSDKPDFFQLTEDKKPILGFKE
jgi:hypothetical protein